MRLSLNIKKTIIAVFDVLLAVYLLLAVTSFNSPKAETTVCNKVDINISDANNAGFLSAGEIKNILVKHKLYPYGKQLSNVDPRRIEDVLKVSPFVNTAECYKAKNGNVCITITQRMPIVRIKSITGDDYYLDEKGGPLPNSKYTSDLIIATGYVNRWFAKYYIAPLSKALNESKFWSNQIEQINVLADRGIELVPRVGDHVIYIGCLPQNAAAADREAEIKEFVNRKLERLDKFYRYGLSVAGWDSYSYINVEFDNQIICKRRNNNITE